MNRRISRRDILAASILLPVVANSKSAIASTSKDNSATSNVLVAYLSRSGNTRVIAGQIQRALDATLFEFQSSTPDPEDYEQTVEQARRERDSGYKPSLAATVSNLSNYKTVFLGFPIWGETAPPVIRSFLSTHDLSGKTLIPFITHGGYGLGNSLSVIAAHASQARLRDGISIQADQERQTLTRVTNWLDQINNKFLKG